MKNIHLALLACLVCLATYGQCDIKTTERPDGNIIKYFNPKPVIRQTEYEIGVSIYKNITTEVVMVNTSVLFKGKPPKNLRGNLIIQTTNSKGISLKPVMSELIEMNGRDVAIGLYEIDETSYKELSNYSLKGIYVYVGDNLVGATVTENKLTLKNNLNCF
ncbi:hypothetical protein DHD32_13290 [Arenibacter sp. TNZ]|uniref:hypothetical protein n=1 Tax=Arenibacter TaxID=178469 RepID=UPI000CD40FF4|nr:MULTISPECIES: hypothetical protein [Arenibacter]MCM4172462.1 hypothetical protein [Arenibacter sp. TNZ]